MTTELNKLSAEWRLDDTPIFAPMHICAQELDAALPKWTELTDDPDTHPADDVEVLWCEWIDGWRITNLMGDQCGVGGYWRPLCSLDFPVVNDNE